MKSNTLLFDARFDTDICEYDDLSKLYGFTDCNSTPLENSARFSFRQQNGIIEIFAFVHNNGAFSYKQVGTVKKDEWNNYKITIHDDYYLFQLNNGTGVQMVRTKKCSWGFYTILQPYFGGDDTCSHDVYISIKLY